MYREAEPAGHSFVFVPAPRCAECNRPIELTGFVFLLIGIVVCLPISMILCAGATEAATGLFSLFMAMALMRWVKQFNAKRRHPANKAPEDTAHKLADPQR